MPLPIPESAAVSRNLGQELCAPSQKGEFLVFPQSQMATRRSDSMVHSLGSLPVFWVSWEPSQ